MQERELAADEMAYKYFSAVRESAEDQLDPETSAQLNELVAMTQAEKDAIFQKTNRVARRVLRPLGYKMLQVQGLDPASVSPAAARAALEADLTPEQQAAVDAEAERLFKQVYVPELQAAAQDLDLEDPDVAWEEFGRSILARQPLQEPKESKAAIAVPAAVAGAVVALVVSKLFGWLQRRRQRRYQEQTGSEYYEEEVYGTDSAQDDASAYDD